MSVQSIPQLVQSLHDVLLQVDTQTRSDLAISDRSNVKKTYIDWIAAAVAKRQAAEQSAPELPQLDQLGLALQYRMQQLKGEAPAELDPLMMLFRSLSAKLFLPGISDDVAEKQLRHLCTKYPAFAKRLLEPSHEQLAADFFRFALLAPSQSSHRGKDVSHWVDIFIKYPEIAERLMWSSLYEKLGQFPENIFIHEEKGVCIKMELWDDFAWIPIHFRKEDLTTKFTFRNKALGGKTPGITLTLDEIFQQFEGNVPPEIEVSSTGIVNLNSHLLLSKESDEKIHRIDPNKWTEYLPSVELEWPELMKLFPEVKNEASFAFVLRVNIFMLKNGLNFFDFVQKHNGKYRVISLQSHQKPGVILHQQKRLFYPLTREQGDAVIRKVAEEIERRRQAQIEGKPIPVIDMQPYLDEILGHDFYAYLERLITELFPLDAHKTKEEFNAELVQAKKNLDPDAFNALSQTIINKLMKKHDMALIHQFITTSLTTIHTMLPKDSTKIILPSESEVTEAARNHFDEMGPSLLALASLCFEVLHPYRMSVAAAEKETPVIGFILRKIDSIPWVWLKNLLYNFFLTILGPFRGYHYKTLETSHLRPLPRLVQSIRNLIPERSINRPSQFFDSLSDAQKQSIEARLKTHMSVLTARQT